VNGRVHKKEKGTGWKSEENLLDARPCQKKGDVKKKGKVKIVNKEKREHTKQKLKGREARSLKNPDKLQSTNVGGLREKHGHSTEPKGSKRQNRLYEKVP